jgi:hypothetical protein
MCDEDLEQITAYMQNVYNSKPFEPFLKQIAGE